MPTYTFKNKDTGEYFDKMLKLSELDQFKEDNPHLESIIGAPKIVSGVNLKPDAGFRDLLSNIKKKNRGAKFNDY